MLGKNPTASDVETATRLVRCHEHIKEKSIWLVCAKLGFLDSIALVAHQIQILGKVVIFSVTVRGFVVGHVKFYRTAW